MSSLAPRILSTPLRLLAIVWLAVGLVAQPLLVSLVEMHEVVEHSAASGTGSSIAQHDSAVVAPGTMCEEGLLMTLHSLHQLAHCCGQSAVAMLPALDLPDFSVDRASHWVTSMPVRHEARRGAPYRPPISA